LAGARRRDVAVTLCAVTFDPALGVDPRKAEFWCRALDVQSQEFAAAWGIPYIPVQLFDSDVLLTLTDKELATFVADTRLMTVQAQLDVPNALGFHDDVAGVIFARVMFQGDDTSVTMSHEKCEGDGDPTCDLYVAMGNGKEQAKEASDRVEGDSYIENANIDGDSMPVALSNYLLPSAFVPNSQGPWDRMGRLTTWDGMTSGGYMIQRDANGNETQVFAKSDAGRINLAHKLEKPRGRLARRLRGRWAP
jgi:hypothetical protein